MRGKKIFDEFTHIKCGKRRYVLRNVTRGLCPACGNFAIKNYRFCEKHHKNNLKNTAKHRIILQILNSLGK